MVGKRGAVINYLHTLYEESIVHYLIICFYSSNMGKRGFVYMELEYIGSSAYGNMKLNMITKRYSCSRFINIIM